MPATILTLPLAHLIPLPLGLFAEKTSPPQSTYKTGLEREMEQEMEHCREHSTGDPSRSAVEQVRSIGGCLGQSVAKPSKIAEC